MPFTAEELEPIIRAAKEKHQKEQNVSERYDHILAAMRKAIEAEIDAGITSALAAQQFTVHGLDFDQVAALAKYYRREIGLDPRTLTPAQIINERAPE